MPTFVANSDIADASTIRGTTRTMRARNKREAMRAYRSRYCALVTRGREYVRKQSERQFALALNALRVALKRGGTLIEAASR